MKGMVRSVASGPARRARPVGDGWPRSSSITGSGVASRPPGWRHAVVVGSGIAGLLAARVLADYFDRVTVLERDCLTGDTEHRRGVPQARHQHPLLARGANIMEALFPGLRVELAEQGAPIFDPGESFHMMLPSGWAPRGPSGITLQTFTRVALEKCIRRRVMAYQGITFRSGYDVTGFRWDRSAATVIGVYAENCSQQAETIDADLVVDASGRTSTLTTDWLREAGFPTPDRLVVEGNLSSTSRLYDIPPGMDTEWTMTSEPPFGGRGGVITPVEGRRWLIAVFGEMPPNREDEFLSYAKSLRNPHIAASIVAASPAAPLYRLVKLNNKWTLFHRMRRWPDRLVCLGDVVCALNPFYAQGMTVAAMEAMALNDLLDRRRRSGDLTGLARKFQRRAARIIRPQWLRATNSDLAWNPTERAPLVARVSRWYLDRLVELSPNDFDVHRRFFLAQHLIKGPTVLLHPRILGRVIASTLRRSWSERNGHRPHTRSGLQPKSLSRRS
jgi:2-polyprenyl-6-methoxyphenol hydroxylase-like FAD-dependent oxidoreductase